MPTYTCPKCARVFKQKSGYDDHVNKKKDCSSQTSIPAIIEKAVKATIKNVKGDEELILPEDQIQRDKVLQAYFEEIHNILWSRAGFEPAKAMEHLTFFFAYRLIELQADKLGLPAECRWSYLASQKSDQDMFEIMKKGYVSFAKNPITKPFFKQPEIKKAEIVYDIVKQINKIPSAAIHDTDTLGNIFEYAQSWGTSTMSSEGQFFTNRKICRLAFELSYHIKKTLRREDGTLCTFADWFCGTGGFPAEYVKGVNENLPDVNWEKDKESIHCQDQSVSACMTTLLNMLIMTGTPFSDKKIRQGNSFGDPVISGPNAPFAETKIDYIFLNPPYGGSKFEYSKKVKGEDGKASVRYFVNQDILSIGIADDDKVSAGVQLAMATLSEDGGVCAIVLPQGFFFGVSKKCIELRKKLTEEYKIHYVVDIASGSFLNTGTKTSILVFQKGVGPTEGVVFMDTDKEHLTVALLDELRAKNYSLNYKQYLAQEAVEVEGFEMVKLGDIIVADSGDLLAKDTIVKGDYPIIGGGKVVGYHNRTNRNADEIVISRVGNACLTFMSGKYYLTDNALAIISKDQNKMLIKYLYYYLTQNIDKLREQYSGTAQPVISKTRLYEIQIPLPSLERQQQIVEAIDGWAGLAQHEEQALKILEKQVMFQVKEMGRGQARVKLGEVCEIKCGKPMPKTDIVEGEVPVIGGGISPMGFHNVSTHDAYTPIISQRGTAGHISRYSTKAWITPNAVIPTRKDDSTILNDDMLFYILKSEQWSIDNIVEKTAQPLLTIGNLKDIEIRIPPVTEQQTLQSDFDEIRHKHAKIAIYKAKAQEAIQRLIPGVNPV